MFEFRELDFVKDVEAVIPLIHKNLDPAYTHEFFTWKHLKNPFGESFGLVALDNGKIIGLRIFMFWEFIDENNKIIRAIRPVDTVVDENYQGKGLFKKLTLQGLELCEGKYQLVFNTPNVNSLPGYLKMGWNRAENAGHFSLGIINPFGKGIEIETLKEKFPKIIPSTRKNLTTHLNSEYLNWRYISNEYQKIFSGNNFIVFSIRKINGLPSLIIHELIGENVILQKMLVQLFKKTYIPLIYFFNNSSVSLGLIKVFPRKEVVITFKSDQLNIKDKILFSIGDLEGKL